MKTKLYRDEKNLIIEGTNEIISQLTDLSENLFLDYQPNGNNSIKFTPKMDVLEIIYKFLKENNIEIDIPEKMEQAIKDRMPQDFGREEPKIVITEPTRVKKSTARVKKPPVSTNSIQGVKLTELFQRIKIAVEQNFRDHEWLEAEISNLNHHTRGHVYLDLIETNASGNELAKTKAIIWGRNRESILSKFKIGTGSDLSVGQKVLLKVQISYDLKYGLSLTVVDINPEFTLGDMEAKLNKIRHDLVEKGFYDKNKLVQIPYIYKKLAVISPKDAAGLKDFQIEADKLDQAGLCSFDYYDAIFQGVHVKNSVVNAINNVKAKIDEYDALIIIRGGGAKSDLHYLNEYDIAKEICLMEIPVIVGIGHQIDSGILDEVACLKEDTPSKVINYVYNVIYDRYNSFNLVYNDFKNKTNALIEQTKNKIEFNNNQNKERLKNSVTVYRSNVERLKNGNKSKLNEFLILYKGKLQQQQQNNRFTMIGLTDKIKNELIQKRTNNHHKIGNLINITKNNIQEKYHKINNLNPIEIFKKGFSVTMNQNKPIKEINDVQVGDQVDIYLKDGKVSAKIEDKHNG